MKKILYLISHASKKTRIIAAIAYVLAIAAIATIIISTNNVINGPIENIYLPKLIGYEDECAEIIEQLKTNIEFLKEDVESGNPEILKEFDEHYGISAREFIESIDDVSLHSLITYFRIFAEDEEAAFILQVVEYIIKGWACILIAFIMLSLLCMSVALAIIILVLSIPFFIGLVGVKGFIIFAILCLAYGILFRIVKVAYLEHKWIMKKLKKEMRKQEKEAKKAAKKAEVEEQIEYEAPAEDVNEGATEIEE